MKYLSYKDYTGSIEYEVSDNLLFGKVLGIQGLISYEGKTGKDLETDFQEAIDEYLNDCLTQNKKPEKPFKGSFNIRISPGLHQQAALLAQESKMSLNSFVAESIRSRIMLEL